jgi:hypothetical protein
MAARHGSTPDGLRAIRGDCGLSRARGLAAVMTRTLVRALRTLDHAIGQLREGRRVVIDARTPMNFGVLAPVAEQLQGDRRIDVIFTTDGPSSLAHDAKSADVPFRIQQRGALLWRRVDLCVTADPWNPIPLRRCRRRVNFFHGVAGKYDLDTPGRLRAGFDDFDRVAFVNVDRMRRYLDAGVVEPDAAVLVGYPKVDALVNGRYDAAAIRAGLQLDPHRLTATYAPTWSPASSLHLGGEAIVKSLVEAGLNVIVKLHDRSLDAATVEYSGGIDWRARFAARHIPGRTAFVDVADSSPLLAASDLLVTDHSSIGFEFCLLDRPLLVFDAPDLGRMARINPEKIGLLRSAARVVQTADEVGAAALDELEHRTRRSTARRAIAREMFHEPGTATARAVTMLYELLDLTLPHASEVPVQDANVVESLS